MSPFDAAWSILKQETIDEINARHENERNALHNEHSEQTGIPNLWFATNDEGRAHILDPAHGDLNVERMALRRMHQMEMNIASPQKSPAMEPMSTGSEQTTLPPELTSGATVGTKDFRNVKFPNFSGR